MVNADQAAKEGINVLGTVELTKKRDSESAEFYATSVDPFGGSWHFEFYPYGWNPIAGKHEAELKYIQDVAWPSLVIIKEGILYPNGKPKKIN